MDVRLPTDAGPISQELSPNALGRLGRFELRRPIGQGAMGVVYEAIDLEGDNTVALKMLLNVTPSQIHRLKNEFRSLAGLVHPNLVCFEGLFAEDGEWFVTMELVDGVGFLEYVRTDPIAPVRDTEDDRPSIAEGEDDTITSLVERIEMQRLMACNIDRLRSAIVQLAVGIETIHRAGKLHRDLKPSNVRVTGEGRLVILDFGLVAALESSTTESFAGTVPYMSPEQAAGGQLTAASDWYSFGVMLFEALTGRRPFEGSRTRVMLDKQSEPAPPVEQLILDAPRDLASLASDLLAMQPGLRPTGAEILARLGARAPSIWVKSGEPSFVGRSAELDRLEQQWTMLERGIGSAIFVHGPSGMGKTALIQRFISRAESRGAVVLRGRCYERESLPFKALDSVIDALTAHLRTLPPQQQQSLIPRRVRALARLFPVLLQVPAIRAAPHESGEPADPRELRRVAVSAFVGMLRRLADQQRLILAIDDLQWGDADSGDLIAELLEDMPALMLLGAFQTDDRAASELLARLAERSRSSIEEIELGPLNIGEARAMALRLLESGPPEHADLVARESAGIPIFVQELARCSDGPPPPLDSVISRRIAKLPPDAARMLDVISIAGRPVGEELCQLAAGVRGNEARVALNLLRSEHLIRQKASSSGVETYHDLIRRSAVRRMPIDQVEDVHRRLARALEHLGASSDLLVHHWRAGADPARAGRHALSAAKKASEALAFERAAHLYRLAIQLLEPAKDIGWLYAALGEACANSGRAPEAAAALLEAVKRGALGAASLQSRAVQLLLTSGHVEPGLRELDRLLRTLDLRSVSGRRGPMRLLMRRIGLRLRGAKIAEPRASVPERELMRIDACWSATTGLALMDMPLAADFHTENLVRSLRSGDRFRYARALGMEAVFLGLLGGRAVPRAQKIMVDAGALIAELDNVHLSGLLAAARGFVAMSCARWSEMLAEGESGEQQLSQCTDASWGLDISRTLQLWALGAIGRYQELESRATSLVMEAEARGDLYLTNMLRTSPQVNLVWLAKDDPARAELELEEEARRWSQSCFTLQHYWSGRSRSQIDLYRGDPMAAWRCFERTWRALKRSFFLRVAHLRVHARSLRARAALSAGVASRQKDLIAIALAEARCLLRDDTGWPRALAERIFGLAALAGGDSEKALARLVRSESMFSALGMESEVAATKRIRGKILGGDEGNGLIASADDRLRRAGVRNASRFTAALTGWG